MKTPSPNPARRSGPHGFTLIEVIMVLAVLVILTAAILPVLTSQLDEKARVREEETLKGIAAGVESYVMRAHSVPGASGFVTAIAPEIGSTVDRLMVNDRGLPRLLLIDDRLRIGTNASSVLPYTQGIEGSVKPVSPRMLLISSVGKELPSTLTNGVLATNLFDAIWNTQPRQVPAGWTWTGSGEDLKIQRIYLGDLFHQLALNSVGTTYGSYGLDNATPVQISGVPKSIYVIRNTRVVLNRPDNSTQAVLVLKNSLSFVCDYGSWRSGGGAQAGWTTDTVLGSDLAQVASAFLAAPANPTGTVNQTQVLTALQNYMTSFNNYAASGYSNLTLSNATVSARTTLENTMDALVQ